MVKKYTYKNITTADKEVPGVGVIKPGDTFETNEVYENPNFDLV